MLSGLLRSGGGRAFEAFLSSSQPIFSLSLAASALKRSTHGRKDSMKQGNQLTTPRTTDAPSALNRRRLMEQVVLGGAAALMLTACGGGGGGDSSSNSKDLVAAYHRLKDGMTWEEAKAAVGWEPNDSDRDWSDSGYLLSCSIVFKTGSDIQYLDSARLSGNGIGISHVFAVE
jgi:hypothetical protein